MMLKPALCALATIVAWSVSVAWSVPAFAQANDGVPKEARGVGVDQKLGAEVPGDLALRDEEGKAVYLGQFFDGRRPVLLSLNYSNCPMLCSIQLNQLALGLQDLDLTPGDDYLILTVSIDPKETTEKAAETKRKYVDQIKRPGMDDAWRFLTADAETIRKLTDTVGFRYRYDEQSKEYYHPAMLAFLSPQRKVMSYQLSVDYPAQQLKLALLDAADGKVGSIMDGLPLLCFAYDAERGSYVVSAWRLMRLGGAATVFIMLGALLPYWLGTRRSKAASAAPAADGVPGPTENLS